MGSLGSPVKEPTVKWTARHNTVMELFQTEKNYVGILHTLLKVWDTPLSFHRFFVCKQFYYKWHFMLQKVMLALLTCFQQVDQVYH